MKIDNDLRDHVARRDRALTKLSGNLKRLTKEEIVAAMGAWLSTECLEDIAHHSQPRVNQ